jgi:hypothetical protein
VERNPPEVRSIKFGELANRPFAIDAVNPSVTIRTVTRGLTHLFYTNRAQINGGANDRFALLSDAGGLTMASPITRWFLSSASKPSSGTLVCPHT